MSALWVRAVGVSWTARRWSLALGLSAIAVAGCAEGERTTSGGPVLAVAVAGLTLPAIDEVCVDLRVTNGTGVVWAKGDPSKTRLGADQTGANGPAGEADTTTLCSGRYGNGAGGDLTYVGTCDAASDSSAAPGVQNDVTLWVDGLYGIGADGADVGGWQDPCPMGCTLSVDCVANVDTLAEFNLTVLRDARQGFFDVAVAFEDIFCSAKLDTCYPDGNDSDLVDDPIRLIHGGDTERDWTAVFGFACTAGPDAGGTNLMLGTFDVVCGETVFSIDPTVAPGNASVSVGDDTLHYAVYRGNEALNCDGAPCNKVYWNVALSLDDLVLAGGTCRLALHATATDPADPTAGFVGGVPTAAGASYPYVEVDATLTTDGVAGCQANRLNETGSAVRTVYAGTVGGLSAPEVMCVQFAGDATSFTGGVGCPGGPAPVVGGLSTPSAGGGDALTFNGTGFGSTPGTVEFSGGAAATVTSWTPTTIAVVVPADGISGPVDITRADGTAVADAPYFAYDDVAPAPLATLNSTAYSIFDLDFDGLGNAYYAEFISGVDRMHRVAPNGVVTTYNGIANYDLGFGAPSWDGTIVSGAYAGETTARGVLLVDSALTMQYLHPVAHSPCSSWAIDGYRLCGPMDPEWGFDGWFYVGNLSASGDVSRYNLTTKEVVATLPAVVVSIATTSDLRLWAAAGTTLYEVNRTTGTVTPIHTFGSDIVSISASQLHRRIYVERVGGVIEEVTYAGAATTLLSGFASPAFITVGPDFKLYRIQGQVDGMSTITQHTLPAPTP